MANFKQVNKMVNRKFPHLDIEVVRGEGYVYFSGEDGYELRSIYTHPVSTSTEDVIRLAIEEIESYLKEIEVYKEEV